MHELHAGGRRILLDCGLYQGRRAEANQRNRDFPFPVSSFEAVILSHAHIDHSGNLPALVKQGYEGAIFGEKMRLRAELVKLNELSAHADQMELLRWIKPLKPHLKRIFLVHGEPPQSEALAAAIRELFEIEVVVPSRGESFELS